MGWGIGKSNRRDIAIQRACDDPTARAGYRVVIDRFWPCGRNEPTLKLDEWQRELALSAELVRRFHATPGRWDEFRSRSREKVATSAPDSPKTFQMQTSDADCVKCEEMIPMRVRSNFPSS